jgi:hypothetical protein
MRIPFLRDEGEEPAARYRREPDGTVLIEIRLNTIEQLFDTFDPAPFIATKDLDREAEDYIVESLREMAPRESAKLVFYLPREQLRELDVPGLESALHDYFRYRLKARRADMRALFRSGTHSLAIGVVLLIGCNALRELVVADGSGTVNQIIGDGLLILAWVAMWRPVQIFVYDWWPIVKHCRLLRRLSAMAVEARTPPAI